MMRCTGVLFLAICLVGAVWAQNACSGQCPNDEAGNPIDGDFPHPLDCEKFCSCNSGVGTELTCPDGLVFDPVLNMCNWPEVTNCTQNECPRTVSNLTRTYTYAQFGMIWGAWMKDDYVLADGVRVWLINGINSAELLEFANELDYTNGIINRIITLPFNCAGTGHVVYKGDLYCNIYATRNMLRYGIDTQASEIKELVGVGVSALDEYDWGYKAFTDGDSSWGSGAFVDFAVDEYGLWVIYSSDATFNKITVSKFDDEFNLTDTQATNYDKVLAGNAFIACGILYVVQASYGDFSGSNNNYIRYTYDFALDREAHLGPLDIPFPTIDRSCMVGTTSVNSFYSRAFGMNYVRH
ncbi:unnamed protein product [Owenia fusiformis]|uniref:Chitinase n=1 Tax=Owenia fusiformis TaxID=6347 RepID=A0A8S4P103_OWEFU|nr:unnamed protein product [Owenia fusiformis]